MVSRRNILYALLWLFVLCLCVRAQAGIPVADVPETLGAAYDLSLEMRIVQPTTGAVHLALGRCGRLAIAADHARWQPTAAGTHISPVTAPLHLQAGRRYLLTLKRREGVVVLLIDHRFILAGDAPSGNGDYSLRIASPPAGISIAHARYQAREPIVFGDDFMRAGSFTSRIASQMRWTEDPIWRVAAYQGDRNGQQTDSTEPNPWQTNISPWTNTSANGFWFLYTGVGPSWVVANATLAYPCWDHYAVQAAVKTRRQSAVGLLAAYQDLRNYVLFRWTSQDAVAPQQAGAALIAVIDGHATTLAHSTRGSVPGQWYTLQIRLGWRRAQVLVDGQPLLAAVNPGPIEGRVGLYADCPDEPDADDAVAVPTARDAVENTLITANTENLTTSAVTFEDVKVSEWRGTEDATADPAYPPARTGAWSIAHGSARAISTGSLVLGQHDWSAYVLEAQLQLPPRGQAGMLIHRQHGADGYLWLISPHAQQLIPLRGGAWGRAVAHAELSVPAGLWAHLRAEVDGPYLALWCNGTRVLETYDLSRTGGRCGVVAYTPGVTFRQLTISPAPDVFHALDIHPGFLIGAYQSAWSNPESDWYPAFTPARLVTPDGMAHAEAGAAAALPTEQAGLYWHKGGHYHDLCITTQPFSSRALAGQTMYLAVNDEATRGYGMTLRQAGQHGLVSLARNGRKIGDYPFALSTRLRLVCERRGTLLILCAQQLDPNTPDTQPETLREQQVFLYRDPAPIAADRVGFRVTTPALPAAALRVESTRMQDAFEQAPVGWMAQSGLWSVMARYTCSPQWNWYSGIGAGTPTLWSKYYLGGDQVVEGYLGVKELGAPSDDYLARYTHDLNMTICGDSVHAQSGYTVMRFTRRNGAITTELLRNGAIVAAVPPGDFPLPAGRAAHRQWFATRIEKHDRTITVYLDNRLAMTYVDPHPLAGGYVAFWTVDNGLAIARANLAAVEMRLKVQGE
jgi:hypothetical protein